MSVIGSCAAEIKNKQTNKKTQKKDDDSFFGFYSVFVLLFLDERAVSSSIIQHCSPLFALKMKLKALNGWSIN